MVEQEHEPVPTMKRRIGCPRCKHKFNASGIVTPDQGGRRRQHPPTNQRHLHVTVPKHDLERSKDKPERGRVCPGSHARHTVSVTSNEREVAG